MIAPNSPLKAGVTALVEAQAAGKVQAGKTQTEPPLISPARGPPLCAEADSQGVRLRLLLPKSGRVGHAHGLGQAPGGAPPATSAPRGQK